jgi:uncharacterized protein
MADIETKDEIDPVLLEILVCPKTRQPLHWDREAQELVSKAAGLAYPVRKGIPIMLPEEARKIAAEPLEEAPKPPRP